MQLSALDSNLKKANANKMDVGDRGGGRAMSSGGLMAQTDAGSRSAI